MLWCAYISLDTVISGQQINRMTTKVHMVESNTSKRSNIENKSNKLEPVDPKIEQDESKTKAQSRPIQENETTSARNIFANITNSRTKEPTSILELAYKTTEHNDNVTQVREDSQKKTTQHNLLSRTTEQEITDEHTSSIIPNTATCSYTLVVVLICLVVILGTLLLFMVMKFYRLKTSIENQMQQSARPEYQNPAFNPDFDGFGMQMRG